MNKCNICLVGKVLTAVSAILCQTTLREESG